jgi:putative oxidoreductase
MKNFASKIYNPNVGLLLIRVALAVVFIYHGLGKFQNMAQTTGFFSMLNVPEVFAYVVAAAEFFGGIALLLGLFVEISAFLLAIVMFVAISLVKFGNGFAGMPGKAGYELDLVLFLVLLGVACLGSGRFALKKFWVKDVSSLN